MGELSLESVLQSNGIDVNKVDPTYSKHLDEQKKATVQSFEQADQQYLKESVDRQGAKPDMGKSLVKSIGLGVTGLTQQIQNGLVGIADYVDNKAYSMGITSKEYIENPDKYKGTYFDSLSKGASIDEQVGGALIQYGAPMVGMARMGVVAGTLADTAYNFITADPKHDRLSNALLEKAPALKHVPAAYEIAKYLARDQNESEFEARAKTALEGLGLGAVAAGGLYGATRAWGAGRELVQRAASKSGAVAEVAAEAAPVAEQAAKITKPVTEAPIPEDAVLNDFLVIDSKASERMRLAQNYGNVAANYVPTTDKKVIAKAESLLGDPTARASLVDKVASWKQGDGSLLDHELYASNVMLRDSFSDVQTAVDKAVKSGNPNDVMLALEHVDAALRVDQVTTGSLSQTAETLRTQQLVEKMSGVPISKIQGSLDNKVKTDLVKILRGAHGNELEQKELVHAIDAIYKLSPEDAAQKLKQAHASSLGSTSKFRDAVISSAMSSFLSYKSAGVALAQNMVFMTKQPIDTYIAAIGSKLAGSDAVTFAQANAKVVGQFQATLEMFQSAGKTLKTGRAAGPANITDRIPTTPISAEGFGINQDSAIMKFVGKTIDGFGALSDSPGRLIKVGDSAAGTAIYRGSIAEQAVAHAEKLAADTAEAGIAFTKQDKAFAIKKFKEDPPAFAHELATQEVHRASGTMSLDSSNMFMSQTMGTLAEKTSEFMKEVPAAKVLVPFTNLGFNLANEVARSSPLAVMALGNSNTRKMLLSGGREAQMAMANIASGTALVGLGAYLSMNGMYTGKKTDNYALRNALDETSKNEAPHTLKIGDQRIDLAKVDYLRAIFDLGHAMANSASYLSKDQYQEAATVAAMAVADTYSADALIDTGTSFLSDLHDAINGTNTVDIAAKYAARPLPMQGLLKNINQSMGIDTKVRRGVSDKTIENPITRFFDAVGNIYGSKIPYFSKDAPVGRNILGYNRKVPEGLDLGIISQFFTSNEAGSEVLAQFRRLSEYDGVYQDRGVPPYTLGLEVPSDVLSFNGQHVQLDPRQHDELQQYVAGYIPAKNPGDKPQLYTPMNLETAFGEVLKAEKAALSEGVIPKEAYKKIVTNITKVHAKFKEAGAKKFLEQHPDIVQQLEIQSLEQIHPVLNPLIF